MEHAKTIIERLFDKAVAYRKELVLAAAVIAVSSTGIAGYFFYKTRVAQLAHKAYAQALQIENARIVKEGDVSASFEKTFLTATEKWQAVADAFGAVYADYNHVGVGVMAGAAQVQALIRLGKIDQARTLLADVLARISAPELRSLYSLTYARLLMDSDQEVEQQKGLTMLSQLAATKDSAVHDSALYYLGLHYWLNDDMVAATNYWKQLVMQYDTPDKKSSPWVSKVKEKLALVESAAGSV